MQTKRWWVLLAALAVLVGLTTMSTPARADSTVLKVGTLAPANSPWGKVFKVWQKGLDQRTHGAVQLQFFWSGQQGDEPAMVGKIRTGQLDGAACTAVGLGDIYKQVLILQTPGIFSSWAKLDAAREKMKGHFDQKFGEAGFKILGWGDVGAARMMSKDGPIRVPSDLKHRKVVTLKGDPVGPVVFSIIGDTNPKVITVPEITTGLTANTINVIDTPALAAEQLQWAPQLTDINTYVTGYAIGALVFSKTKFEGLPADAKQALQETGAVAASALTNSIRRADDEAFARLAVGFPQKSPPVPARMKAYTPNAGEIAQWQGLFKKVRDQLRGSTFKADIMDEVEAAAK